MWVKNFLNGFKKKSAIQEISSGEIELIIDIEVKKKVNILNNIIKKLETEISVILIGPMLRIAFPFMQKILDKHDIIVNTIIFFVLNLNFESTKKIKIIENDIKKNFEHKQIATALSVVKIISKIAFTIGFIFNKLIFLFIITL